MTEQELEAIKARAAAASPGPWVHEVQRGMIAGFPDEIVFLDRRRDVVVAEGQAHLPGGHSASRRDALFIAHAREDVPALVAEVERLREEVLMVRNDTDMSIALACATLEGQIRQHQDNERQIAKERNEARVDLAGARHEVGMLQACGAILLRTIYESGIAYDNPEVELALAAFAGSPE